MTVLLSVALILAVSAFIVLPLLEEGDVQAQPVRTSGELWAREKAVAVLAISEADFDRATGKLSDDDYRVLRSDYEGRALQAMDEIDRLTTATAAVADESSVRFCAGCGSRFAASDQFCGSCGRRRFTA